MKIAYDHQIFGWQEYGGISRYFFELANHLAGTQNMDVSIVSPLFVNAYLEAASSDLTIVGRKAPLVRRTGRIYRAINQWLAPRVLRKIKPDLLHETYYASSSVAPKESRVVLSVFDMIHERFPESFSSHDKTSKEKAIAVDRADHVICISHQTRTDLMDFFKVDPAKISVVHLGFTLTNSVKSQSSAVTKPYLLYVGQRGGYKNFESLLHAYATEPRLHKNFDLVAFGGGGFKQKEKEWMSTLGFDDGRVRQVAGGDGVLARLYSHAALFVYPSLYEGFGIPPLEAMNFQCPVVCSRVSSIPEVVGEAAAYFDPTSPEDIANTILRVLNDRELTRSLIDLGLERIKLFSWARCAQETRSVYERIVK